MRPLNKILSVIIAICFMVNNVAFAFDQNTDTLAVATKLTSTQFQQVAQIEIGIRVALKGESGLDLASLAKTGRNGEHELASRSIFGPKVDGRILFREAEELNIPGDAEHAGNTNYGVRAVVGGVEYGCILSFSGKTGTYDIVVVPYETYVRAKTSGSMKVIRDTIDTSAREILNRYIEHEVSGESNAAIDPWIADKMSSGTYAVDTITANRNPLYGHPLLRGFDRRAQDAILAGIGDFLKSAGASGATEIIKALMNKPLVFIPYVSEEELPVVTIDNAPVRVTAHSSQFATYLFVPKVMFDEITISSSWSQGTTSYIKKELVHEAGAICGLPAAVLTGATRNVFDMAYADYMAQGNPPVMKLANGIENIIQDARPIDLTELEMRNDYASGKAFNKKSSFKRTIAVLLAAFGIGMAATTAKAQIQILPLPTLSTTNINLPSAELIQAAPSGASVDVTDGAYIDYSVHNFTTGTGTNKVYSGARLMSEKINGINHVYVGFTAVGTNNLQTAISSATPGSIVVVKAGTYTGNIMLKDGVKVMGGYDESGNRNITANTTVINGKVTAQNITTPTEFNGFTVKVASNSHGIDINGSSASLVILNNKIIGGDGLDLSTSYNIGISATNSQAVIYNNSITNCHWFGIYAKESSLTVENNIIRGNYRDGVQELYGNSVYRNNFFWDNGLMPNSGSQLLLFESASTLDNNTLYGDDMGIFVWNSEPVLTDNIFTRVADQVYQAHGSVNSITESGSIKDPTGSMNLGIDPASGAFTSPSHLNSGYNPQAAVPNYNKAAVYGMTLAYATGTGDASWAAGGYSYDLLDTPNVIESVNLSGFSQIIVGIQGTPTRVKMEVWDANRAMKSVYLTQVSATREGLWYVASSELAGVDLSRVASILFVVEGENISGTVSVQTVSGVNVLRNIPPATGLTTNDINLATSGMTANFYPANASATTTNNMATGVCTIQYTTGTNQSAWASGGFSYDNLGTTNLAEVVDLSRLSSFVLGVRGTHDRYKMEVRDLNNNKASVYLTGVTGTEQIYSIPVSLFTGIDMMKISDIVFVAEGDNKTGSIYVRTLTKAPVNPYDFGPTVGLGASDMNLIMPATGYFVQSSPFDAYLTLLSDGFMINSGGLFTSFMGGGYNFAAPVDYSKQTAIILGITGQLNTTYLPLTFTDADGKSVTVQLNSVGSSTKYWMIPTIYLRGIDLTRVVKVSVGWSGYNLAGSYLHMHGVKTAMPYDVVPSAGYTTNNVNLGITGMYINPTPAGSTSTVTNMGSGVTRINYTTASASSAWAAGGFAYDNLGTTNTMENVDLSGLDNIVIGLRSDLSKIKMEVEDVLGAKSSVYLTGVTTTEQFWSISTSLFTGVDLAKVRFISFVAEGDSKTGSIYVRTQPTITPSANIPYASGLTSTNINLTTKDVAGLAPAGSTGTATATSNGMSVNYNTGTNDWAGGMFSYDLAATPGAIETIDMSGTYQFIFGLKGDSETVKMEFKDSSDHTAVVYLTGIDPVTERFWSIDRGYLAGIDLSKITGVAFIIEGAGKSGTLSVHSLTTAQVTANINPSPALSTNDINLATTMMTMNPHPTGGIPIYDAQSTVTITPTGMRIDYYTGTGPTMGWSGGSFSYDNLGTTNTIETMSLYGYNDLVIGLRGSPSQVKMEIEDITGAKATVNLMGITATEQIWSVPVTLLSGIDLGRVRFITFTVSGDNKTGSLYVDSLTAEAPQVNIPADATLTAGAINVAVTTMTKATASTDAQGSVTNLAGGLRFTYNTGTNDSAWSAAQISYDAELTIDVTETYDLAALGVLKLGLKGTNDTVKLEIEDNTGKKVAVNLIGIDPNTEKIWAIDPSFLRGIDLTRVRAMNLVMEGANKAGTLDVRTLSSDQMRPIIVSTPGATIADINLPATYTMELPRATLVKNATGLAMSYNTDIFGWAGAGLTYDNFGTPPVETRSLSGGSNQIKIGLKGPVSRVKMEIEDATGKKGAVYLDGIDAATEKIWSIPTSYFPNVDLDNVRFVLFIVEGNNLSGTLDIHVIPQSGYGYAMNEAPLAPGVAPGAMMAVNSDTKDGGNLAALVPFLGMLKRPSRKKPEPTAAEKIEKAAIMDLQKIGYMAFPSEEAAGANVADAISEVLWQAAQSQITSGEANTRLEKLTPDIADTTYDRKTIYKVWLDAAKTILLGLGLSPIGKHKAPTELDIRAVADRLKDADIEIYIPSSQIPADLLKELRKPVQSIFGDKIRVYQNIEDLQSMVKDPARAIIMTVDLTDADLSQISKLRLDIGLARFMNFEKIDPKDMSAEEYQNYFAETVSMLIISRVITMADMQDKGSPTYRMLTHLLESHMDETADIDAYISNIVDTSISPIARLGYILKSILKSIPVSAYKIMKPAVEVLWSA